MCRVAPDQDDMRLAENRRPARKFLIPIHGRGETTEYMIQSMIRIPVAGTGSGQATAHNSASSTRRARILEPAAYCMLPA